MMIPQKNSQKPSLWHCASVVLPLLLLLFISCGEAFKEVTEADLSAFGHNVYDIDSTKLEQNMSLLLGADTSDLRADVAVRKLYKESLADSRESLWVTRMGVSPEADSLLALLRTELPLNGLDSTAFFVPQIASDLIVANKQAFDSLGIDINEFIPRLEYNLSRAYVRYTTGQHYGFMNPEPVLNHHDWKSSGKGYARLFDFTVEEPDAQLSIEKLCSDDRMSFVAASQPVGGAYTALRERLKEAADTAERRTLAVNIERCRWQMKRPGADNRYVFVNLPAQQLWAVGPDTVLNMRICCGAIGTKTPLLSSAINTIQVNPDWIIPHSILRGEVARHAGDSAYFARRRYYIVNNSTGEAVNAAAVSPSQLSSGNYRVGQRGGVGNSLGRIVFRFPNEFAVYLHDTNNHSAFSREQRTLSHGCVRVEKPFELALFLLPGIDAWTADKFRLSMDITPQTDRGRQYLREHAGAKRPLRLIDHHGVNPNVPVHICYYTAYPNPATKHVDIWPDIYGYDKLIARHMQTFIAK